ncbi:laminin subunit gamma-2 [Paramisgurnus dabryanus]|uniref:laminin subunit gamma-2 n=1 Tax=Paramisgurnus dabryanus TaxID=90735 RepID=UPI0031F39795
MRKMKSSWIFLCAVCIWFPVTATQRRSTTCYCYGKAQFCKADHLGLYCINCKGNTEGRQCESCKEGYYHQGAGDSCVPCDCNIAGSQGAACNNEGRCTCKQGIHGDKCDRCHDGSPVGVNGCKPSRSNCRSPSNGQLAYNTDECLPCFCNGHSDACSSAQGYSIHNITSTFERGPEGWRAANAQGVTPSQVQFRWSPTHKDLEVISQEILPIYLFAPASYLGNQALSYGQMLTFSLRLDRGVRRPSSSDVILEGAGLKVSASLGDLRSVVPCGKKINFAFRLDEQPSSKWKPQLSSADFQTLLSNLTAIKIRGTFGENGRGYLDDVALMSAKLGPGTPADWVEKCSCPAGYDGLFCERCATGYRRRFPGQGPRSPCDPCSCQGGTCDPETGGCYSADEIPSLQMCPKGQYINRQQSNSCLKCPCPEGDACYLIPGTEEVMCVLCPLGTTGSRCEICDEGFYGDPLGEYGPRRQCRPCQCFGHVDQNCDRQTGECQRCPNHSTGPRCENCIEGYYHSHPTEPCQACDCDQKGSVSNSCSYSGQCKCREGYEGLKCEKPPCPSCFDPLKNKISAYTRQLQDMEYLLNSIGGNNTPIKDAQIEKTIKAAEVMVQSLQTRANELTDTEIELQEKLASISRTQLIQERNMEDVSKTVYGIRDKDQRYKTEVSEIRKLISEIRRELQQAKRDVQEMELPSGDAEAGSGTMSYLVQKAADLAEKHQGEAVTIENIAANALSSSEKAVDLIRSVIDRENTVRDNIKDLRKQYEADVTKVNGIERKGIELTGSAERESDLAQDALKKISELEKNLPKPLQKDISNVVSWFDGLKGAVDGNITQYQDLQKKMLAGQKEAGDLLNKAKNLQKVQDSLLARANEADAVKNRSLEIFAQNTDSLDNTLEKLKGFDDQINTQKKLADKAISKLPAIEGTIQKAKADNIKTQDILNALSGPYRDSQDTIDALKNTATKLEDISKSLPSSVDILNTASKLKGDLDGLNTAASLTKDRLNKETSGVKTQINQAKEAAMDATGALDYAKNARNAVSDTLKSITDIMGSLGSPVLVDEKRVSELEKAVDESRRRVENELRPKLKELEEKEAQQRDAIKGMINDIDTILIDIVNLEHIHKSIPIGCYNLPPIERP